MPAPQEPALHTQVLLAASQTGVTPAQVSPQASGVWHCPATQVWPVVQQTPLQLTTPVHAVLQTLGVTVVSQAWLAEQQPVPQDFAQEQVPAVLSQVSLAGQAPPLAPQLLPQASWPQAFEPQLQTVQVLPMQLWPIGQHLLPHTACEAGHPDDASSPGSKPVSGELVLPPHPQVATDRPTRSPNLTSLIRILPLNSPWAIRPCSGRR